MKESFYFPHDYNARTDPKLQEVIMELGVAGIGVYWCVIEQLYEQKGVLPLSSVKSIAFALHVKQDIINRLINDFGLFENDGEVFWSNSVRKRLGNREAMSAKRRQASKKANQIRWHGTSETDNNDNDMLSDTENSDNDMLSQTEDIVIPNGEHCNSEIIPIKGKEKKRNIKESNREKSRTDYDVIERFFRDENSMLLDKLCMDYHTSVNELKSVAVKIVNEWQLTEQCHTDYNDAAKHLLNLIRIKFDGRNNSNNQKSDTHEDRKAAAVRIIERMQADEAAGNPFATFAEVQS